MNSKCVAEIHCWDTVSNRQYPTCSNQKIGTYFPRWLAAGISECILENTVSHWRERRIHREFLEWLATNLNTWFLEKNVASHQKRNWRDLSIADFIAFTCAGMKRTLQKTLAQYVQVSKQDEYTKYSIEYTNIQFWKKIENKIQLLTP